MKRFKHHKCTHSETVTPPLCSGGAESIGDVGKPLKNVEFAHRKPQTRHGGDTIWHFINLWKWWIMEHVASKEYSIVGWYSTGGAMLKKDYTTVQKKGLLLSYTVYDILLSWLSSYAIKYYYHGLSFALSMFILFYSLILRFQSPGGDRKAIPEPWLRCDEQGFLGFDVAIKMHRVSVIVCSATENGSTINMNSSWLLLNPKSIQGIDIVSRKIVKQDVLLAFNGFQMFLLF